jgi:hypothetical protein
VKQARLIDRAYCPVRLVCNSFRFGYVVLIYLISDFDGRDWNSIIWGECTWIYKANIERVWDGWVMVYNEMN